MNKGSVFYFGFLIGGLFCTILMGALIYAVKSSYLNKNIPEAIDVYRNKTTLRITYQDSIPVDSVVVFKNKIEK